MRALILALLLALSALLVVRGVALWSDAAAWITAGVLLAGLSMLVLVET